LAKFRPSTFWDDEKNWPEKIGYSKIYQLKAVLPQLVKVLPEDHFKKVDLKAANRLIRLKRT